MNLILYCYTLNVRSKFLFFHELLGPSSVCFPSVFPIKILYIFFHIFMSSIFPTSFIVLKFVFALNDANSNSDSEKTKDGMTADCWLGKCV
jgi:hypothetical protein